MPKRGRPRTVAHRACGTKLFVDDLREVVKLSQVEDKTISDLLRELVHETLLHRRLQAMGRDREEIALHSPDGINEIKELIGRLVAGHQESSGSSGGISPAMLSLLTEILGFSMTAEMKVHLLLHNFLVGRGLGEESVKRLIAEHEEKSRLHTEKILASIRQSPDKKEVTR